MPDDEHLYRILDEMSRQSRYRKKLLDEAMFNRPTKFQGRTGSATVDFANYPDFKGFDFGYTDEGENIIDVDWRTIEGVKEIEG
jgi:hypothetical protein